MMIMGTMLLSLILLMTSIPLTFGIIRSNSIRAYSFWKNIRQAVSPSGAISVSKPSALRKFCSIPPISLSSSTIKILAIRHTSRISFSSCWTSPAFSSFREALLLFLFPGKRSSFFLPLHKLRRRRKEHIPGRIDGRFKGILHHADDKADAYDLHGNIAAYIK